MARELGLYCGHTFYVRSERLHIVYASGRGRVRFGHTVMVTYPYAYMTYIVSPLAGLGGGISWRPPVYTCLYVVYCVYVLYVSICVTVLPLWHNKGIIIRCCYFNIQKVHTQSPLFGCLGHVNNVLYYFRQMDCFVKYRLFRSFCTAFYGCELCATGNCWILVGCGTKAFAESGTYLIMLTAQCCRCFVNVCQCLKNVTVDL